MKLNVGAGRGPMEGWLNLDLYPAAEGVVKWDVEGDESCPDGKGGIIADNSVDQIIMSHVIEHLHDPLKAMDHLWRLAKPGTLIELRVPHGASDSAWTDITHLRPWFPNSFRSFGQPWYWRADYGFKGDWMIKRFLMFFNEDATKLNQSDYKTEEAFDHARAEELWLRNHKERNIAGEMVCVMEAIKPVRENRKELQEGMHVEVIIATDAVKKVLRHGEL